MGFLKLKKVFGGKKKKNAAKETGDHVVLPSPSAPFNTEAAVVKEATPAAVQQRAMSLPPKPPSDAASQKVRYTPSYASGASTPEVHSDDEPDTKRAFERKSSNPKMLSHSTSAIGLDEMIEDRRCDGGLAQNIVHLEVPFGKPIEEVYEGVHSGPVLGSGISGLVRLVTHKATGHKYAVKVLDLGLVDNTEGLQQLREEIFIMCQVRCMHQYLILQSILYLVSAVCSWTIPILCAWKKCTRAHLKFIWCKSSAWVVNCLTVWTSNPTTTTQRPSVLVWSNKCSVLFDTYIVEGSSTVI